MADNAPCSLFVVGAAGGERASPCDFGAVIDGVGPVGGRLT